MSSETTTRYLTRKDLSILQKILTSAGYSGQVWETSPPNVAAKLLIGLFQEGMTDPADLSRELELRFGSHPKPSTTH